jgi:hypothetical protein
VPGDKPVRFAVVVAFIERVISPEAPVIAVFIVAYE